MKLNYPLWYVVLLGVCHCAPTSYPDDGSERMRKISEMFQHEVIKSALDSLDSIMSVVNISTALQDIQTDLDLKATSYEDLATLAPIAQKNLTHCKEQLIYSFQSCAQCLTLCEEFSLYVEDALMTEMVNFIKQKKSDIESQGEFKKLDFKRNVKLLEDGLKFIDNTHKEVSPMLSFLVHFMSQMTPTLERDPQMKKHLEKKLQIDSAQLVKIFDSLKLIDYQQNHLKSVDTDQVEVAIERIETLLSSMSGGETVRIDGQDLIPLVPMPTKEKNPSIWEKVRDTFESAWRSTKDVSSKVWHKTTDVTSNAFCSVKSVFFNSDCNDKRRRRRRSASSQSTLMTDHGDCSDLSCKVMAISKSSSCSQLSVCAHCSVLEESPCEAQTRSYQQIMTIMTKSQQDLVLANYQRSELVGRAELNFEQNLWILPLAYGLDVMKQKSVEFEVKDIIYDPENLQQKDSKVFYNDVKVKVHSPEPAEDSQNIWLTLDPIDVHNITQVAHSTAHKFTVHFKDKQIVKDAVAELMTEFKMTNNQNAADQ